MKNFARLLIVAALAVLPTYGLHAQGREWLRQQIAKSGECRNVAITRTGGDLMLYGKNGYAASYACPQGLVNALKELHDDGEYIDDVQITEKGRWIILFGNNGIQWHDIPYSLEKTLRKYHDDNEVILSVTFNDDGDWIVIAKDHFSSSDTEIQQWLKEGLESYGKLWSACITDDARVAVYAKGYQVIGDIPPSLIRKLKDTNLDVYRLKIAGSAWFFADTDGHYSYNM